MPNPVVYIPKYPQENLSVVQHFQDIGFHYKEHIEQFNEFYKIITSTPTTNPEAIPSFSMAGQSIQLRNRTLKDIKTDKSPAEPAEFSVVSPISPFDDSRLLLGRELLNHITMTMEISNYTIVINSDGAQAPSLAWLSTNYYQPGETTMSFYGVTQAEAIANIEFPDDFESVVWEERLGQNGIMQAVVPEPLTTPEGLAEALTLLPFVYSNDPYLEIGSPDDGTVYIYGIPPRLSPPKPDALYGISYRSATEDFVGSRTIGSQYEDQFPNFNTTTTLTQEEKDEINQLKARTRTPWKWHEPRPTLTTTIRDVIWRANETSQTIISIGQMIDPPYYFVVQVRFGYAWSMVQVGSGGSVSTRNYYISADPIYMGNEEYKVLGDSGLREPTPPLSQPQRDLLTWEATRMVEIDKIIQMLLEA